ncbi:helix-turn-helix domain-containing protein [Deinococcus misasensis]|uniref:helix-turn-helix domain-containing protein n=1 Tax=Deinococcus misasensis TaxID=392413 RepID=UPI000554A1D6|nr:helix-turn-helix domain-containing protein [Deinococcus misasensis]
MSGLSIEIPGLATLIDALPQLKAALEKSQPIKPLGVREAAEFLDIGTQEVYRLAGARLLPGIKVGNGWKFDPRDLSDWVRFSALVGRQITVDELRNFQEKDKTPAATGVKKGL